MTTEWYYVQNDVQHGPHTFEQLQDLALAGQLQPADRVWHDGMAEWGPASEVAEFWPAKPSLSPPPLPRISAPTPVSTAAVVIKEPPTANTTVVGETLRPLTAITVWSATAMVAAVISPKSVILTVPVLVLLGLWLLYTGFRVSGSRSRNSSGFKSAGWVALFAMVTGIAPILLAVIGTFILFFLDEDDGNILVRIIMVMFGVVCLGVALLSRLTVCRIMERKPAFTTKYLGWTGVMVIVLGLGIGAGFSFVGHRGHVSYEDYAAKQQAEEAQKKSEAKKALVKADALWKSEQQAEAVEAYTVMIQDGVSRNLGESDQARVFVRVIDYLVKQNGPEIARPFAKRAVDLELMLVLTNPDAIKLYSEEKKAPKTQWGDNVVKKTPPQGGFDADQNTPATPITPDAMVYTGVPDSIKSHMPITQRAVIDHALWLCQEWQRLLVEDTGDPDVHKQLWKQFDDEATKRKTSLVDQIKKDGINGWYFKVHGSAFFGSYPTQDGYTIIVTKNGRPVRDWRRWQVVRTGLVNLVIHDDATSKKAIQRMHDGQWIIVSAKLSGFADATKHLNDKRALLADATTKRDQMAEKLSAIQTAFAKEDYCRCLILYKGEKDGTADWDYCKSQGQYGINDVKTHINYEIKSLKENLPFADRIMAQCNSDLDLAAYEIDKLYDSVVPCRSYGDYGKQISIDGGQVNVDTVDIKLIDQ